MTQPATPTAPRATALRALAAAVGLLLLLAGPPLLLAVTIASPVPGWQDLLAGDVSATAVIAVLATLAWLAWAQFALAVLAETFCAVTRIPVPRRLPGVLPGQQHLARTLVTAVLVLLPALSPLTGAADIAHAAPIPTRAGPTATASLIAAQPSPATTDHQAAKPARDHARVMTRPITVTAHGPGTLWDLAREHLGSGDRWHQIWDLNAGRTQADGTVMSNPGLLVPGWVILIPASHPDPAPASASPAGASEQAQAAAPDGQTLTVRAGENLEEIARSHATTWPQLWTENQHRPEPGGQHFEDPDHVEPGWHLTLPTAPASLHSGGGQHPGNPHRHQQAPTPPAPAPAVEPSTPSPAGVATPAQDTGVTPLASTPAQPPAPAAGHATAHPMHATTAPGADRTSTADRDVQGLGAGAGLLAAAALIALLRSRRRQQRHRHPGHTIAATPGELLEMEKVLLAQGSDALGDVTWLDEALRDLTAQVTRDGGLLPEVIAARMSTHLLELLLAGDTRPAPHPWRTDPLTGRWQLRRQDHDAGTQQQQQSRRTQCAPYPTLVSVGYTDDGDYWLLDLEQVGSLTLTGDRRRCLDLARFLAAELAHNPWSEQLQVTLVGVGAEVRDINPQRVTYTDDAHHALAALAAHLRANTDVLTDAGLASALHGRQQDVAADQWMPNVLILDPATDPTAAAPATDLQAALGSSPARTAIALILTHPALAPDPETQVPAPGTGWQLVVDAVGDLQIPALGLSLHAQQLPAREAGQLARLLATTERTQDRPTPPARGHAAWDLLADAAGAPLPDLTVSLPDPTTLLQVSTQQTSPTSLATGPTRIRLAPAHTAPDPAEALDSDEDAEDLAPFESGTSGLPAAAAPGDQRPAGAGPDQDAVADPWPAREDPEPAQERAPQAGGGESAGSLLPHPLEAVLAVAATTGRDVQVLAPTVTAAARRRIEDADADLEEDLLAWNAPQTSRPRLSLLGPLLVRAAGSLPVDRPRLAWHTEVVAYLAAHPRGVSAGQLGTDLWPRDPDSASKSKLRNAIYLVRRWLGEDPATLRPYLPAATTTAAGGVGLYRVEGLLTDADLFRRLRLRGVARGVDGLADLESALALVTGAPFDQRRPGGYGWLADIPLDYEYTGMIVDVAHLVATRHLVAGRPDLAAQAAHIALLAGSRDDIALLDLVAACDAQGAHAEATTWIQRILTNHDAEVEEDLPPRTAEILHQRAWIDRAS